MELFSKQLTEAYAWAIAVLDGDPEFELDFLAMCVLELAVTK
jgi:hypothetical protein